MDYISALGEIESADDWLKGVTPDIIVRLVEKVSFNSSIPIYLVIVGMLLLSFISFVFVKTKRGRNKCKWKKSKTQSVDSLTQFQCKFCGVVAFTADRRPPKECKINLKHRPL